MPATNRTGKVRRKISGSFGDAGEYRRTSGQWVREDPDAPVTNALAIAPASQTSSLIPSTARWGQAAEFSDILGVNVHFRPSSYDHPNFTDRAASIADLAGLGCRHIRESVAPSFIDTRSVEWRRIYRDLHNRNLNLPAGQQPIFFAAMVPGLQGWQPFTHRTSTVNTPWDMAEWYRGFDGGQQHRDNGFNLIPNGTTSNPQADIPNPWNFNDPEFPWEVVDFIMGANEPGIGAAISNSALQQAESFIRSGKNLKLQKTNTNAYGGGRWSVVTTNGLQSAPIKVSQLPTSGPSIIFADQSIVIGDWTDDPPCDFGDAHPYHPGQEPSHEHFDREVQGTFGGLTTGVYNGNLRNPPNNAARMPFIISEFGMITRGMDNAPYPAAHAGYWPTPDDIIAEYLVRMLVLYYIRGVRRAYVYEMYDSHNDASGAESNFGLLTHSRVKKHQYYSLRNLLSLVGWTQGLDKRPIRYSISGFTPQGAKWQRSTNTIVANGSGFNQHNSMFSNTQGSVTPPDGIYEQTAHRLDTICLQQNDNTWIIILAPQVMLWDREPGNWNMATNQPLSLGNVSGGRFTPNTQNITVTFTGSTLLTAQIATPTDGGTSNPDLGRTWNNATITNGNQVVVPVQGKTKLLRVTI